jgi:FlaA1/EpsC-like NDP-sugar epimerase
MLSGLNEELALPLLTQRPKLRPGPFYSTVLGRRILITGAGGSIGSELALQVAASEPAHLTIIDHSELALYEINCTLREAGFKNVTPLLVNIRDPRALEQAFSQAKPDLVYHAAALKHVPLLENDHNLIEAVLTNVKGTMRVASMCVNHGADFVLVSTDKAVNPSSVMGLTKRVAEIGVRNLAAQVRTQSVFSQVRFGNVLGSSGSVVPLFRRQIAQGGPVTVTDPEMTRYLMSIKQAVALTMMSAEIHKHRENREYGIYILDMGEPVRILDLAWSLITTSGLRPNVDIPIEITGIRPGEKLHEELSYEWEEPVPTSYEGVRFCVSGPPHEWETVERIGLLVLRAESRDVAKVKETLTALVPQYTGKELWV